MKILYLNFSNLSSAILFYKVLNFKALNAFSINYVISFTLKHNMIFNYDFLTSHWLDDYLIPHHFTISQINVLQQLDVSSFVLIFLHCFEVRLCFNMKTTTDCFACL